MNDTSTLFPETRNKNSFKCTTSAPHRKKVLDILAEIRMRGSLFWVTFKPELKIKFFKIKKNNNTSLLYCPLDSIGPNLSKHIFEKVRYLQNCLPRTIKLMSTVTTFQSWEQFGRFPVWLYLSRSHGHVY